MKFAIRDVVWLTVLAAVLVAWMLDHGAGERERHTLHQRVQEAEVQKLELALELENAARARPTLKLPPARGNSLP
jgi:hypothetical protein